MNNFIFSGRITADAETRYTKSGTAVSNFSVAVDTGLGDYKRTDFIRCVLWKRENLVQYLTKGKPVIVQGEYQERKWEDKEGNKRSTVEIVVRQLDFQAGDSKKQGNQSQQDHQSDNSPGPTFPSNSGAMDDVPF